MPIPARPARTSLLPCSGGPSGGWSLGTSLFRGPPPGPGASPHAPAWLARGSDTLPSGPGGAALMTTKTRGGRVCERRLAC
jgi:hypothetical protein